MTVSTMFDAAGRRRSPATMPGYHAGRPPRNKGLRYPATSDRHGWRRRVDALVPVVPADPIARRRALTHDLLDHARPSWPRDGL
jgi:hypothetical protein